VSGDCKKESAEAAPKEAEVPGKIASHKPEEKAISVPPAQRWRYFRETREADGYYLIVFFPPSAEGEASASPMYRFFGPKKTPFFKPSARSILIELETLNPDEDVVKAALTKFDQQFLNQFLICLGNKNNRCDDHSLPIVNAIIAGQKHLRLLVDTGSKGLMLFGEGREYGAPNIDVTGGTRLNTQPGLNVRRVQLPNIDFGRGTVVKHPRAYLIEPRPSNLTWIDGFLGGGGEIGLSSLRIDMHEQTVRLRFRGQP
jgi:hypothetical protein